MGGSWDKPNMDSEPDKARWLAKGNPEEMLHESDINHHEGATVSLSQPIWVYSHIHFPANKHLFYSISMWKFISTQLMGQGFVTGHSLVPGGLVARIQHCHCHRPQALAGDRNPASIITGGGHLRSGWQSKTAKLGFGPLLSSLYSGFSDLTIWVWSRSCFL